MNILLFTPEDFIDHDTARISGRRFQHLKKILKASVGKTLTAGMLNGPMGSATIINLSSSHAELKTIFISEPPKPLPCLLILALPRPLMLKRILQAITTLGIKEIHFIHSNRVEKSFWSSSDLAAEVIHQQLIFGLEQAIDTVLPNIYFHKNFSKFSKETLPELSANKINFLANPESQIACPSNIQSPFTLAIGPEGGFSAEENNLFISQGFQSVHIGSRVLRVETAVSVLLGKLLPF